jgi:hypothetical protein
MDPNQTPKHPQRNAADPEQVRHAGRKDRRKVEAIKDLYRKVMATPEGRAVFWDILERAGVFRSVWHPSALIHYNAGRQDFGHEVMAELLNADEALYIVMEQEARARNKRDDIERAAIQTPSADQRKGETTNG